MNYKKGFLFSITFMTITGCASEILRTEDGVPLLNSENKSIGAIYYLPNALIPVNIKLQNAGAQGGSTGSGATGLTATQTNSITINNAKPDDAKKSGDKPVKQYVVAIGANKYVPDMTKAYTLEYNPEIATDDKISISVGPNQLLQTSTSLSRDESGQAVVMLAQIAGEAAKMAVGIPGAPVSAPASKMSLSAEKLEPPKKEELKFLCKDLPPINIETFISPSTQVDNNKPFLIGKLNSDLANAAIPIQFKVQSLSTETTSNKAPKKCQTTGADSANCYKSGVLLRSPIPYVLTVEIGKNIGNGSGQVKEEVFYEEFNEKKHKDKLNLAVSDKNQCLPPHVSQDYIIMAPNDGVVYSLDVQRARFVTKKTDLTITDGMLTKIDVDKPSELIGALSVPLDALKAIAGIPASMLSVQVKNTSDQASLYKAQSDLLGNQIQLLKNQQELKKLQESDSAKP